MKPRVALFKKKSIKLYLFLTLYDDPMNFMEEKIPV